MLNRIKENFHSKQDILIILGIICVGSILAFIVVITDQDKSQMTKIIFVIPIIVLFSLAVFSIVFPNVLIAICMYLWLTGLVVTFRDADENIKSGLLWFIVGYSLLTRTNWFSRHYNLKYLSLLLSIILTIISASMYYHVFEHITSLIPYVGAALIFHKAMRPITVHRAIASSDKVFLTDYGLSENEQLYILAIAEGKTSKEIAFERGVSDSTIRSTLTRAYRKIGVSNKSELLILLAGHKTIVKKKDSQ